MNKSGDTRRTQKPAAKSPLPLAPGRPPCKFPESMKLLAILLLAALPALSEETKLFNGKDFTGWTFSSAEGAEAAQTAWTAKDGVLICSGQPTGYIRTKDSYENYTLTFEWRWTPGSTGNNSGLLLHIGAPNTVGPWPACFESQLQQDSAGDIWMLGLDLKASGENQKRRWIRTADPKEKPAGEWNTMTVTCKGDTLSISVNGTIVNEATGLTATKGAIGFQSEGVPIELRSIVLKTL
jgi:hypothetical protein